MYCACFAGSKDVRVGRSTSAQFEISYFVLLKLADPKIKHEAHETGLNTACSVYTVAE